MAETIRLKIEPYPRQVEFFKSKRRYIAYGGARGGGKSWAARVKAVLLALNYKGMQILLLRRTFAELRENHTLPLQTMLKGIAEYRDGSKEFIFPNGSRIKLGYCSAESDVLQYQGQAYDVIFLEEATQFTEFQFQTLTESNRASGMMDERFVPRMYFTCNPGGVGHAWVKRLFIDKEYRGSEKAEHYDFIASTVYDNRYLMEYNPEYIEALENLPEMRRRAMLHGDWDAFDGQYFPEWDRSVHVIKPHEIPSGHRRFLSLDYGLDMTAAYWWSVDYGGFCTVYRELHESGLILSDAGKRIAEMTGDEDIEYCVASPDLWNRRQETGESGAEIIGRYVKGLRRADSSRIPGWRVVREYLQPAPDEHGGQTPRLRVFETCFNLVKNFPLLQYDANRPEDAAGYPHEITHSCESVRYGVMSRPRATDVPKAEPVYNFSFERPVSPLGLGESVRVI